MTSRLLAGLLTVGLLTACGADPTPDTAAPDSANPDSANPDSAAPDTDQGSVAPPASSSPTATTPADVPVIEGLEVLAEDPGHEHQPGPIEYERVPPLGGPHNPRWLACDVYDEPVPAEFAVHSIEHGAIWITYAPDLPAEQVALLAELADLDPEYVLVSPQSGLDSRIVAVSWGLGLEASSADDPRLLQLVEAYAGGGQGGEAGAPCRGGGLTLREALGQLGSSA